MTTTPSILKREIIDDILRGYGISLAVRQKAEMKLPYSVHDGAALRLTFGVDVTPRFVVLDAEGYLQSAATGWVDTVTSMVAAVDLGFGSSGPCFQATRDRARSTAHAEVKRILIPILLLAQPLCEQRG